MEKTDAGPRASISEKLHNRPDRAAGAALKLRATSHSCYVIRCVRPGRVLGQRAGPGFRPDRSFVRKHGQMRSDIGVRCSSMRPFGPILSDAIGCDN